MPRAAVREVDLIPRQDTGYLDARYPTGVVAGAVIVIAPIPDIVTITAGQTYSEDLSGYITNTGGAYTTTFEAITGTLAAVDLTAGGDTIESQFNWTLEPGFNRQATGNQNVISGVPIGGSVFLQLSIVGSDSNIYLSNIFQRTIIQPLDTSPPTTGEGLLVTLSGLTATVIGDWPSDPTTPGILASGLARVLVESSVNSGSSWQNVATLVPANPGASPPLVSVTIGSPLGTNTATQSGRALDFSAQGGSFSTSGGSDACIAMGAQMQGDYEIDCTLAPFTSTYGFSSGGIMIRGDTTTTAQWVRIARRPTGSGNNLSFLWRPTAGTATQFTDIAEPANGVALTCKIVKSTNLYTAMYWANGQWNAWASATVSMGQTTQAMGYLSTETTGVTVTSAVQEYSINILGQWTTSAALSPAVPTGFRFRGVDVAGNVGANASTVTITANPTPHQLKFNAGIYLGLLPENGGLAINTAIARMAQLAADPKIRGFEMFMYWQRMENPNVAGDYSGTWDSSGNSGFVAVDALLAECASTGTHLMLGMYHAQYGGGNTSFPSWLLPAYLNSPTYGGTSGSPAAGQFQGGAWYSTGAVGGGFTATSLWWTAPVMARIIALMQAYGARYDSNPHFEMFFGLGESAVPSVTGYTAGAALTSGILTGPTGYFQKGRAYFPTSLLRWCGNYTGIDSNASVLQFIQAAVGSYWHIGGPDTCNETGTNPRVFWVDRVYRGCDIATGSPVPGYTNYVGQSGWVAEVQAPELGTGANLNPGASFGDGTTTSILAHANLQGATHIIWMDNNWAGINANRTQTSPAGIHPNLQDFFDANPLTNTLYPPLFP